jgi:hypothetical protein
VLALVAGLGGIYLGLYYNLLVLLPATLVAALICGAAAFVDGQTSSSFLTIVFPSISLQGGYMIGLTGRGLMSLFLARLNGVQSRRV